MMLHRRFLGILVGLTAVVAAFGQGAFSFKINEVVVSNTDGLIDEYGERTGWIEIANTSWGTNNLRSCYLTTNREALNKGLSVPLIRYVGINRYCSGPLRSFKTTYPALGLTSAHGEGF